MSDQDYNNNTHHQGIFSFNGLESSHQEHTQQHIAQQIRRDKLRLQSEFEVSQNPLVSLGNEGSYESGGVFSEMFNFHSTSTAPPVAPSRIGGVDWYGRERQQVRLGPLIVDDEHQENVIMNNNDTDTLSEAAHHHHDHQQQQQQISRINADSSTEVDAMQLFMLNPRKNNTSNSSSSSTSIPPTNTRTSYMLPYGTSQFPHQWGNQETTDDVRGGFFERGSLSLSLSSSKGDNNNNNNNGMMYFNQEGSGRSNSSNSAMNNIGFRNLGGHNQQQELHFQNQQHQFHHLGSLGASTGTVNLLRNSRYSKAAQELLEEFCNVGRGHHMMMKNKKNKIDRQDTNPSSSNQGNNGNNEHAPPPLSGADRIEHQRRKVKLLSMLDEVERRYTSYSEQMQMVVNSFDLVMGYGAALPYTSLAQKAMSKHFRCLKDSITTQLKHSFEVLGEKDASATSGLTKGETPRLKILEQSLRQQRGFHQMGMMEQEAWRPQRGLPDRSVNVLRAWLFEHFLHPYPSDADKQLLARQTGLSRNQVSNWFINARVRLWKPMVEEMYQQESKEETQESNSGDAKASTPHNTITTMTATTPSPSIVDVSTSRRTELNEFENDNSSFDAINRQRFLGNQPKHQQPPINSFSTTMSSPVINPIPSTTITTTMPSLMQPFPVDYDPRGSILGADFGIATTSDDIGSTLMKFGTSSGNVSLTLGLRHPGDLPENNPFSVRDFESC